MQIDVTFIAPVTCVFKRSKRERTIHVRHAATVEVPEVTMNEAPTVFLGGKSRTAPTVLRRSIDGRIFGPANPILEGYGYRPLAADEVQRLFRQPQQSRKFLRLDVPDEEGEPFLPLEVDRIIEDKRVEFEELARARALELRLVDGDLNVPTAMPLLRLDHWNRTSVRPLIDETRVGQGFCFANHRLEAMREFARQACKPGGLELRDPGFPEIARAQATEEPEDRMNARYAALMTVSAAAESLPWMKSGLAELVAKLIKTKESLEAGSATPAEIDAMLAEIHDRRKEAGRAVLLKNVIEIGRLAISMSQSAAPAEPIRDEDLLALAP